MERGEVLDVRGLLCPLPVLKARKRLQRLQPGERLRIEATDPAAVIDVPHFCAEAGHRLVSSERAGDLYVFVVERGGRASSGAAS